MAGREHDSPGHIYHRQLVDDALGGYDRVYRWLRGRGLRNSTISRWKLGYVGEPLKGHEDYQGMLVIPYIDGLGRERDIRFRQLRKGRRPKYISLHGGDPHLFGVMYTASPIVYITEGEIDCMILHQMGYKAVGVPGAQAWQDEWKWMFRAADEVIVVPDGDGEPATKTAPASGGIAFRGVVLSSLRSIGVNARRVVMPDEEDVNTMYLGHRKKLVKLLEGR